MYDFVIVGGGIVGLSTAMAVRHAYPDARLLVLEKESRWGYHQTGHNSGVIHSGIYYKPGSYKATFCRAANRSVTEFCEQHNIRHEMCGKLIAARSQNELPLLDQVIERGKANGIRVRKLRPEEIEEIEPHVKVPGAVHILDAGIVDYEQMAGCMAQLIAARGGSLRLDTKVEGFKTVGKEVRLATSVGEFQARFVISCAGLQSDRLAQMEGLGADVRIIPFRGDYYELKAAKRGLVRSLIYPVPNSEFPFLGVHLVRSVDGLVHAGPNAALNLSREGYRKEFNFEEFREIALYPGLWKLGGRFWREAAKEIWQSLNKAAFLRAAQRLVPEIEHDDLEPAPCGIRAQAVSRDGTMLDDFTFVDGPRSLHVVNAPSPAATCAIEIGNAVAERLKERLGRWTR